MTETEAKNRLEEMLGWAAEHGDEVIVESHGKPWAVIMSAAAYAEIARQRAEARRAAALAELRAYREEAIRRNQDLTEEQAMALADRFAHEVIEDMIAEGKLVFARDQR